jgi:hypothetical protein
MYVLGVTEVFTLSASLLEIVALSEILSASFHEPFADCLHS